MLVFTQCLSDTAQALGLNAQVRGEMSAGGEVSGIFIFLPVWSSAVCATHPGY